MCRLLTRNSSGLLAPGDIFKNHQKYLIERYFFHKLTTRRTIEKIQFLWLSNSIFSILGQIWSCIVYRNSVYDTELSCWKCLKCLNASVYDTGHFCIQGHRTGQTAHCALVESSQTIHNDALEPNRHIHFFVRIYSSRRSELTNNRKGRLAAPLTLSEWDTKWHFNSAKEAKVAIRLLGDKCFLPLMSR